MGYYDISLIGQAELLAQGDDGIDLLNSIGEQEIIGKAISSHVVFSGDYVNVYYLPDSTDEVEDVVIEGEIGFYGPGSNEIDYGIFF